MLFRMRNERQGAEVTNRSVPRQDHTIETARYFAEGLESSAPTVSEEDRMPTVQNLSEVQRKCGVRGRRCGGGGFHDDFPGVEISIAGAVEEMVRACPSGSVSVQYILGSEAVLFLRAFIFVVHDVLHLVGMHTHLISECCGRS